MRGAGTASRPKADHKRDRRHVGHFTAALAVLAFSSSSFVGVHGCAALSPAVDAAVETRVEPQVEDVLIGLGQRIERIEERTVSIDQSVDQSVEQFDRWTSRMMTLWPIVEVVTRRALWIILAVPVVTYLLPKLVWLLALRLVRRGARPAADAQRRRAWQKDRGAPCR